MGARRSITQISDAELKLATLETLRRLDDPVTPAAAKKALPPPFRKGDIQGALRGLVSEGRAHAFSSGKTTLFSERDPRAVAAAAVLEALRDGPLARGELKKRVRLPKPLFDGAVATLVESRGAFIHPKVGKQAEQIALVPPDLAPHLAKVIKEARAAMVRLSPCGVTAEAVLAALGEALGGAPTVPERASAPAAEDDSSIVRRALLDLTRREPPGTLLAVRALRAATPGLDKARFDRAVLALSSGGAVVLHHHDFPTSLSPQERAGLVEDGRGIHYVGIALRNAPR